MKFLKTLAVGLLTLGCGEGPLPVEAEDEPLLAEDVEIDGWLVAEGDILVGKVEELQEEDARQASEGLQTSRQPLLRKKPIRLWPNGVVPLVIAPDLATTAKLCSAISHYHQKTRIRFKARWAEDDHVFVKNQSNPFTKMSFSAVGMSGDRQEVLLHAEASGRTAIHELGHTLGFHHEHSRPDRDDFIRIDQDCLDPIANLGGNYRVIPSSEAQKIGAYDLKSVMHYGSKAGKKGLPWDQQDCHNFVVRSTGEPLKASKTLSAKDVAGLHSTYFPDLAKVAGLPPADAVFIVNSATGKCMEVDSDRMGNGASIHHATCTGISRQYWYFLPLAGGTQEIVSAHSGKCFAVTPGTGALKQASCSGAASQQFKGQVSAAPGELLMGVANGTCLDLPGSSSADGLSVNAYACDPSRPRQAWQRKAPAALGFTSTPRNDAGLTASYPLPAFCSN